MRRFIAFIALVVSGCSSAPDLRIDGPTAAHIVNKVKCEIYMAINRKGHDPDVEVFEREDWTVQLVLTLDVTENGTLSPTIALTNPYHAAAGLLPATNLAFNAGLSATNEAHRIYSETTEFKIKKATDHACKYDQDRVRIIGDLGIEDTLRIATHSMDEGVGLYGKGATTSVKNVKGGFAHTAEFTVTRSIGNTGPTWNLNYFKGPGPGLSPTGFFAASRKDIHRIEIGFGGDQPHKGRSAGQNASEAISNIQLQGVRSAIQGLRLQ